MYCVAIVGRPNVGKSTLFNRLVRRRRALVGDEPGITRDWILETVEWNGRQFELIDTGGIDPDETQIIPRKVFEQADIAIQGADLVLLMVDVRSGLTPLDEELAAFLKSRGQEFWIVANKVDTDHLVADSYQFSSLGVESIYPVSAEHNLGIADLLADVVECVPETGDAVQPEEIRVAIVGRPNVGKSSIVNRLLGRDRVIVSCIPGTTRDSVDTPFSFEGQSYRIIDTAGIRRKGKTEMMTEKLSVIMARKNIQKADVVLLVLDATEGATKLDATIGGYAYDAGKSIVVLVNKWDLIPKDTHTAKAREDDFRKRMRYLEFAPMVFVSALTGQRIFKVLRDVKSAYQSRFTKVPTAEMNQFVKELGGPVRKGRAAPGKMRIKFACQVGVAPPTFVLFLRGGGKLHFSSVRFLSNRLRERYNFYATPLKILQRTAKRKKARKLP